MNSFFAVVYRFASYLCTFFFVSPHLFTTPKANASTPTVAATVLRPPVATVVLSKKELQTVNTKIVLPQYRAEYDIQLVKQSQKIPSDVSDVRGKMVVFIQGAVSSGINSAEKGINFSERINFIAYPYVHDFGSDHNVDDDFASMTINVRNQTTFFEQQDDRRRRQYHFVVKRELSNSDSPIEYTGSAQMFKDPMTGLPQGGQVKIYGKKQRLGAAYFPLEHWEAILQAIKKGDKSFSHTVYNSAYDCWVPMVADVLISDSFTPKIELTNPLMPTTKAWTVQVSYYPVGSNDMSDDSNLVIYTMLENGVILKMIRKIEGIEVEMTLTKIDLFTN